ncbi:MAG: hypothetical protein HY094_09370 [Candidatus Melainabacteria bacterium]|nr:hypothetical protein [Candidatus Melainabacteria bacterium]
MTQFKITAPIFSKADTSKMKAVHLRGITGEVSKNNLPMNVINRDKTKGTASNGYWWQMPQIDVKSMQILSREDSTFGRLPFIGGILTEENTAIADTATSIGTLNENAANAFNRTEPIHVVFPATKKDYDGDYIFIAEEAIDFLPAIAAITTTIRANLPHPKLWKYLDVNVRISSNVVKPGESGEAVERHDINSKPRPSTWHNHMDGTKLPVVNMPDIVVAGQMPTMFSHEHRLALPHENLKSLEREGWTVVTIGNNNHLFREITSLTPTEVLMMSRTTFHSASKNINDKPIYRTFMRAFTRIDHPTTEKILKDKELKNSLRTEPPEQIYISNELDLNIKE